MSINLPLQKMNQSVMVAHSKYENKKGVWVWPFNKYLPWMMVHGVSRLGQLEWHFFALSQFKFVPIAVSNWPLALMLTHNWISSFSCEFVMRAWVYCVNLCANLELTFESIVKRDVFLELFILVDSCLNIEVCDSCNLVAT